MTDPAAPPRRNGELVFERPWEGRSFGIATALVDHGHISRSRLRERLIAEIADWEQSADRGAWSYYERWLRALESLLVEERIITQRELAAAMATIAARAEHEHEH